MWTRRQQSVFVFLFVSTVLFCFSSTPESVQNHIDSYHAWAGVDVANGEVPLSVPTGEAQNTRITETTLPGNAPAPGFTLFDRLYMRNGTLFAVTSDPGAFPALEYVLSQAREMQGEINIDPTPREMQVISPDDASNILGERAVVLQGVSFILWDSDQFMAHYYHWWGELILGAMRVYSALSLVPGIQTPLPEPRRFLLPNVPDQKWRDRSGVNGPLMRAGWPDTTIERMDAWRDMINLDQTFVFERAMVVCRPAAHKSPLALLWHKMVSSSMNVTVPEHFWEPLRERVVRNTIGYLPLMNSDGGVVTSPKSTAPVVTYISRQGGGRRLTKDAHDGLVQALQALQDEGLCEFNVVVMELLTFPRQIEIVARSTILVGIHGNGLTHQLWMPPSPRSTIIEIFYPKTYLHDYEILARSMDHKHYAVWNDTTLTYPEGKWFKGVEYGIEADFNGYALPVHGPTVANIIRERLTS